MRYLLRLVPERECWLADIEQQIPQLEVVRDATRNAMDTFLLALLEADEAPAVHIEDDAILTSDFVEKVEAAITEHPDRLVQFFSRRKDDAALGSRWMPGRGFSWNICFYLPAGYGAALHAYYPTWPRRREHPTGYDLLIADWLGERRERYWLHVPSLVQHRSAVSTIDPRRSSHRHSASFRP